MNSASGQQVARQSSSMHYRAGFSLMGGKKPHNYAELYQAMILSFWISQSMEGFFPMPESLGQTSKLRYYFIMSNANSMRSEFGAQAEFIMPY
jgi:hypothetical protein